MQRSGVDDHAVGLDEGTCGQAGRLGAAMPHDVEHSCPVGDQMVDDDTAVAPPPYGFRTHDRAAPVAPLTKQILKTRMELRRQCVVSVVVEAFICPECIDVRRHGTGFSAEAAERSHVLIANVEGCQSFRQRVHVELRIGPGPRNCSDVHDPIDSRFTQQLDKLLEASVGMADREEGKGHAAPSSCMVERAALVRRDVIGLVTLDLVLGIVF